MGFRESFGLEGQGFRVWTVDKVVDALRLTISRQEQPHKKYKKNTLIREVPRDLVLSGSGSNSKLMPKPAYSWHMGYSYRMLFSRTMSQSPGTWLQVVAGHSSRWKFFPQV